MSSTSSSNYLLFAFIAAPRAVELTLIGNKFCLDLLLLLLEPCFSLVSCDSQFIHGNSDFLYIISCHSLSDKLGQNAWACDEKFTHIKSVAYHVSVRNKLLLYNSTSNYLLFINTQFIEAFRLMRLGLPS